MQPESLKAWRLAQGLSWAGAAEKVGCHPRTWARWERGERKVPHWLPKILETLEKTK